MKVAAFAHSHGDRAGEQADASSEDMQNQEREPHCSILRRIGFPGAYWRFCHQEESDSVHFSSEMKMQSPQLSRAIGIVKSSGDLTEEARANKPAREISEVLLTRSRSRFVGVRAEGAAMSRPD